MFRKQIAEKFLSERTKPLTVIAGVQSQSCAAGAIAGAHRYSLRRLLTGFALAARRVCQHTVMSATVATIAPAAGKTHQGIFVW